MQVASGDDILDMPLETYITCVLAGEMPVSFEMEALKAQAVAIRTYTLRTVMKSGKHSPAQICTDPACCQAFSNPDSSSDAEKLRAAVQQTQGLVLMYGGELIDATYFSCSGGRTEAALEVWGSDVPYLQSVDSPGEEIADCFVDTKILSKRQFCDLLGLDMDAKVGQVIHTAGGGVKTVQIGDQLFMGTQLRKLLNLRSSAFTISETESGVMITTRGYGHRVGMSQYGAEAMALTGDNYDEILAHYYPGTNIEKLTDEDVKRIFDKEGIL